MKRMASSAFGRLAKTGRFLPRYDVSCHLDRPLNQIPSVAANRFDLVGSLGGKVALTTIRADNHGHLLNHQQIIALAEALGYEVNPRTFLAAKIAAHVLVLN